MGRSHLICMFAKKIVPLHLLILLYMKRLFLVFAVTLCVLTACNTNRDRLIEINGYLNDNRLDTAQICLNMVSPNDLSEYDKALAIIKRGKDRLKTTPRADMDGFVPCEADRAREERYQRRLAQERRVYDAIRSGRRIYDE